jgi:penicillin-binding protein 1B
LPPTARFSRCRTALLAALVLLPGPLFANPLLEQIGRSEVRVRSAAFPLRAGGTLEGYELVERLERLGYQRVSARPGKAGQFFWGSEKFWIFRRSFRRGGREEPALLIGLSLERQGKTSRVTSVRGESGRAPDEKLVLEPELLAESLDGKRAVRVPIEIDQLPERIWRPLLAAEDARFFEHAGLDGLAIARALLKNVLAGRVKEGGSTITQQLIKNRDLTSERSLERKATEAAMAVALESQYEKKQILEAYLDQVYLGHVDGLAIHGYGTAARVYFGKRAAELSLAEAATLAAMVQGPNRLAPDRHPQAAKERRDWVLGRMLELEWAKKAEVAQAKATPIKLAPKDPRRPLGRHAIGWAAELARKEAGDWLSQGKGVVIESTLDPLLQELAEKELGAGLEKLRAAHKSLRSAPLEAALVTLDAKTGAVLAYVGGDPRRSSELDRARAARRQPGSAIKPLVLLEAFENCGKNKPLNPASRLADEPFQAKLPAGPWSPQNNDGKFRGAVSLRLALRESLNVPFVRLAYHCGMEAIAGRLRQAGLSIPATPPPSLVLGALEVSPLELAAAYTAIAGGGDRAVPMPALRFERPGGRALDTVKPQEKRVASAEAAWLVRELMRDAAKTGTARAAGLGDGLETAAKTGTSSDRRDAWLAGFSGALVTVIWVGRDDGAPLGLGGAEAAAPIWKSYMAQAAPARPGEAPEEPRGIVHRFVDPSTGLLVRASHPRANPEIFRRGNLPPKDHAFWPDKAAPVIR